MKTLIFDSNYICYKAYLTTGYLQHGDINTGVIFGFFSQFFKIAQAIQPNQYIFCWDSKKSKRKLIYPDYKSKKRERTEYEKEEFQKAYTQFIELRKNILPQIGLGNSFMQIGYEADDLIAKYVMDNPNDDNIVVTGDDDLLQLLDYCRIYHPKDGSIITKEIFIDTNGISPGQWKEVKKTAGCLSDSVPGIDGVGEKTAIKYLRNELKKDSKSYQKIQNNKEVIQRNKALVVLPFENTKKIKAEINEFKMIEFLRICREYGMNSFRTDKKKEEIKNLFTKENNKWQKVPKKQTKVPKKQKNKKGLH